MSSFENFSKSNRRKTRELAMQVLFVWDSHGDSDAALAQQVVRDGSENPSLSAEALRIATAAWDTRTVADTWIERLAPKWPPHRQPGVDRNLLRLAIWEMTSGHAPAKVVIDEAIELAKVFSTEQSPSFINGVLDAVHREQQSLLKE
jgi:N utilization substance protein B